MTFSQEETKSVQAYNKLITWKITIKNVIKAEEYN